MSSVLRSALFKTDKMASQPVSKGGMWNTAQHAQYSKETQDLLKTMMQESKLTNLQQRKVRETLKEGQALPVQPPVRARQPIKQMPPRGKALNPKNCPSLGIRTREQIEASGAYEKSEYRPAPVRGRTDKDKEKLANIMAFGDDLDPEAARAAAAREAANRPREPSPPPSDRFDELMDEITERREFLERMESLGQGKKYRTIIATEISRLLREMEVIDKNRSDELEKMIAAEQNYKECDD